MGSSNLPLYQPLLHQTGDVTFLLNHGKSNHVVRFIYWINKIPTENLDLSVLLYCANQASSALRVVGMDVIPGKDVLPIAPLTCFLALVTLEHPKNRWDCLITLRQQASRMSARRMFAHTSYLNRSRRRQQEHHLGGFTESLPTKTEGTLLPVSQCALKRPSRNRCAFPPPTNDSSTTLPSASFSMRGQISCPPVRRDGRNRRRLASPLALDVSRD